MLRRAAETEALWRDLGHVLEASQLALDPLSAARFHEATTAIKTASAGHGALSGDSEDEDAGEASV